MVKWFKEIGQEDFYSVGGKGYNLSRMYNAGLKVPGGFVVTSEAYDTYLNRNDLREKIRSILESSVSSKEKSGSIKELFSEELLSGGLKKRLLSEFSKIASGRVAVRSSSTVEDLPGMSFAGQYSSYLNVTEKDLLEKILLCWRSLWNERAIDYRNKYNVTTDFSHGVVVQEMINSAIAGVIFTANPLTGIRSEILVNASYGLGEAIVSGRVNPDQYTIDGNGGEIIKEEIARKEELCRYAGEGIEYVPVPEDLQAAGSLKPAHVASIVKEAGKIQDYFGTPQDIEFSIDKRDELFIVQSRDITTLFPIESFEQDGKLRAYMSAGTVLLGMKEPFTPLGFDVFSNMFPTIINIMTSRKKPLDNSFVKMAAGRIFVDITYLLSSKFVSTQFAKSFGQNDLPLEATMVSLIENHGKRFTRQGIKFKIPWGVFKYGFSMIGEINRIGKIPPGELYDHMKREGDIVFQRLTGEAKALKTIDEKLRFIKYALVEAFKLSQKQGFYCLGFNNIINVNKILKKMFGDEINTDPLTQSFPGCITVELGLALNRLAKYFDESGTEPTGEHPRVKELLAAFGHRSTCELDLGVKRWSEDPGYLLGLIKSYMVDGMYTRNLAEIREKAEKAEELTGEIYRKVKMLKGEKKAVKIRKMITDYRIAAGMREYPKFDIVRILAVARRVMLNLGMSLQSEGLLDEPEDIFFLRVNDFKNREKLKLIVLKNKESYGKEMARVSIPRFVLNTGETYYSAQKTDPGSKVLQGMPLSAGIYEGKIRVVFDPNTSELEEGEILVTESTNPAWTPLFIAAKGLIMEYGGPVSHGGIVAREYGIPAVVGIASATNVLKDGQRVRINGETGTVEILE